MVRSESESERGEAVTPCFSTVGDFSGYETGMFRVARVRFSSFDCGDHRSKGHLSHHRDFIRGMRDVPYASPTIHPRGGGLHRCVCGVSRPVIRHVDYVDRVGFDRRWYDRWDANDGNELDYRNDPKPGCGHDIVRIGNGSRRHGGRRRFVRNRRYHRVALAPEVENHPRAYRRTGSLAPESVVGIRDPLVRPAAWVGPHHRNEIVGNCSGVAGRRGDELDADGQLLATRRARARTRGSRSGTVDHASEWGDVGENVSTMEPSRKHVLSPSGNVRVCSCLPAKRREIDVADLTFYLLSGVG